MYYLRILMALSAVMFLCSCASSKRMMKLSPFNESSTVKYDPAAVNLWPAFYSNGSFTSAAWPIYDGDERGFAVRPFFNQDGKEYSILFPLTAWNPDKGDGWVLNTYWNKRSYGSVPFFHCGQTWGYLGPVFYSKEDQFVYIFPFFAQKGSENGWLFPLYLYGWSDSMKMILPVFGTVGMYYKTKDSFHYRALNCFYTGDGDFYNHSVLPLYYYQKECDKNILLTLLGGREWDNKTGENAMINIAGPIFIRLNDKEKPYTGVMWPFFVYRSPSEWQVWPLYSRNSWISVVNYGDQNFNILGPFVFKSEQEENKTLSVSNRSYRAFLFFSYDESYSNQELMPGFDGVECKDPVFDIFMKRTSSRMFCPFHFGVEEYNTWNERDAEFVKLGQAVHGLEVEYSIKKSMAEKKQEEMTNKETQEKITANQKKIGELLRQLNLDVAVPESSADISALNKKLYDSYCRKTTRYKFGFPFLFDVDTMGKDYKWNFLLFLARGDKKKDQESFRVMEYFYNYRRDGAETRRLIFPFVITQSAPEKSRLSVCWRLYEREDDHGKVSGHIFFIPYGKK